MIFAVAGVLFGFVLGYMVANASSGGGPPARLAAGPGPAAGSSAGVAPPAGPPAAAASSARLDPAEVRTLTALAEREKKNLNVRLELGQLLLEHGQAADAVRWYREALALDPGLNAVRVDLAAGLIRAGQYDAALAELDSALKADPANKGALFNKGLALMQSGQPKLAVAVWDDLVKRYPNDPQLKELREQIQRVRSGAGQS
jgi:tetratricopeptide (TPR) repeat protein